MNMNHEGWLAQAEIYALGALDGDELTAFESHLAAGCPTCERHISTTREALTLLPRGLSPASPPTRVKEQLLAQIAGDSSRPQPVRRLPNRRWWMIGASALVAASLLLGLSYQLYQARHELQRVRGVVSALRAELEQRDAALQAQRHELQLATEKVATLQADMAKRQDTLEAERSERQRIERAVATLESEIDEHREALRTLSGPQVRLVRLAGLAASPAASAQLLWNPAARTGLLLTTGLPRAAADKVYELWAIAGNEPVPAGIFEVDAAGHGFLRLPQLPRTRRFDKFAVTLEPPGGMPKPTGPMHLLGSL
jgi:anti-sigma-K factor RskA